MDVTLQYFDDCPNWRVALGRLDQLTSGRPDIHVVHQVVSTSEDAERIGFRGSPTILVDDVDPFADPAAPIGLACRVYETPDGPAGSPTLDQLRTALAITGAGSE